MSGANASLLALVAAGVVLAVGYAAIHVMRSGFDYMSSRGNPRNRAQAHESLWDIGKGVLLVAGAGAIGAFLVATIKFA